MDQRLAGEGRVLGRLVDAPAHCLRTYEHVVALETLRDVDLLDPDRMHEIGSECEAFYTHLDALFAQVSRRKELSGHPFDKKEAIETLKLYLGAA